jgi:hypothetical protein
MTAPAFAALIGIVFALPAPALAEIYGDPDTPIAGQVLGTMVHTTDADELRYVVLKRLTDRYAAQHEITVTQAEKDAYVDHLTRTMARDRKEKEARRDELQRRLASRDLTDTERQSLASELDTLRQLLTSLGEIADSAVQDPAEAEAAHQQVADAFILQWKINRALYRQYGGRIGFQQGGPEPLDAYRQFLEESQAQGDFEILDKALADDFWRYYKNESIHSFYPPGSDEEARAFATPWWEEDP